MRISNSFSEGEIQVLEFIVQTLLRGGTPTMATRSADFPSLCRKVQAMKKKVQEQKARPVPEESSVGTVSAPAITTGAASGVGVGVETEALPESAQAAHVAEAAIDMADMARAV